MSAARPRPFAERERPRQQPHAESGSRGARDDSEPPPRKSGGRAPRHRGRGGTTKPALGAPAQRRRQRRRERRATATAPRDEATAPTTTRSEREPLSTTHRAELAGRHFYGYIPSQAPEPPPDAAANAAGTLRIAGSGAVSAARRRPATAPREEATAPTTARRERKPLSTTHRAERASRRRGRAAAECHAAANAAARLSRRQERERGAAGSGAVRAARRRPSSQRGLDRADSYAQSAHAADYVGQYQGQEPPPQAAAAEHDAAVSTAAWRRRRKDNERGAAGIGAVRAARRQAPSERMRLH